MGSLPEDLLHHLDDAAAPDDLGGKGANLVRLRVAGFPVPNGFCVRAVAYRAFVESNGLLPALERIGTRQDLRQLRVAREAAAALAPLLEAATAPSELAEAVRAGFRRLRGRTRPDLAVAVRSSALSEDSASASSAGQYETILQVRGEDDVLAAVLRCFRSLWSERAIHYRAMKGLDGRREAMAVVVMEMVPAEASGVAFTVNPLTGDRDTMMVNAAWGLGEAVVSGVVTPDNYLVDKRSLRVLACELGAKAVEIVPDPAGGGGTVQRPVASERAARPAIGEDVMRELADLCRRIEEHYGAPQDVEWALCNGRIFVLQARPVTSGV